MIHNKQPIALKGRNFVKEGLINSTSSFLASSYLDAVMTRRSLAAVLIALALSLVVSWRPRRPAAVSSRRPFLRVGGLPLLQLSTTNAELDRETLLLQFAAKTQELGQIEHQLRALASDTTSPQGPPPAFQCYKDDPPRMTKTNYAGNNVPPSAIYLSVFSFQKELAALLQRGSITAVPDSPELVDFEDKINSLQLSNEAIWAREKARLPINKAPLLLQVPYYILCFLLDALFKGRPIARLFYLETVARMPYFAYISCLHLYETLGWWRRSTQQKRIHFAEEINEFNHLLVMESLGGSRTWSVRFLAQHSSIAYFFILVFMWLCSPSLAYGFSELIEGHAVDTYSEFVEANRATLEGMAVPQCARDYWEGADLYLFDEFQSQRAKGSRRPVLLSLYDVFCTIRDDEAEHVNTMRACADSDEIVQSPNNEAAVLLLAAAAVLGSQLAAEGGFDGALQDTLTSALESGGGLAEGIEGVEGDVESLGEDAVRDSGPRLKGAMAAFLEKSVDAFETLLKFLI